MDVVRLLLAAGVNPNPQLNMHRPGRGGNSSRFVDDLLTTGATPLLRAAIGHDSEAARVLLEHGAVVDLPNVMGVTPLMGAAGMGVSARDRRLNYSGDVQSRAIDTLEILLAAGADINARVTDIHSRTARIARISTMSEREGQTALFGAVKWGWTRVVARLIDRGAEIDIVDALGNSPLDAAMGRTGGRDNTVSEEIAELLKRAETGEDQQKRPPWRRPLSRHVAPVGPDLFVSETIRADLVATRIAQISRVRRRRKTRAAQARPRRCRHWRDPAA